MYIYLQENQFRPGGGGGGFNNNNKFQNGGGGGNAPQSQSATPTPSPMALSVKKNRYNGQVGKIELGFNKSTSCFFEIQPPE